MNRYPDPHQRMLRKTLATLKGIDAAMVFTGNGSDEVIDLLMRMFCYPGVDNIIILPPTYGMYGVSAGINDVEVREVPLTSSFQPDVDAILAKADGKSKKESYTLTKKGRVMLKANIKPEKTEQAEEGDKE